LLDCALLHKPAQVNRKAYSEDAQGIIRRQRAAVEKIQSDNASIKQELDTCSTVRARLGAERLHV